MALLLDTGILYALADADDDWHERARGLLREKPDVLLVPLTVLPEAAYLIRLRLGPPAELAFVGSVVAGELSIQSLTSRDFERVAAIMTQYPDIGFVDASVVAIAERLRLRMVATTDRRHFGKIRPLHAKSFSLLSRTCGWRGPGNSSKQLRNNSLRCWRSHWFSCSDSWDASGLGRMR